MVLKSSWTDRPTEEDRLGFEDYRNSIVKVIWEADTPITIGIFGTWGSGKTSLMRMVKKDLEEGKGAETPAKAVWFEAWKYNKEDVLWRALILSTLEALRPDPDKEDTDLEDLQERLYRDVERETLGSVEFNWQEAAKGTIKLGLSFLPLLPSVSALLNKLGSSESKDMVGAPKDAVDNLVGAFRREKTRIYKRRIQFLEEFQKDFGELVCSRIQEKSRLVIFIDDLDRCLPEKAVEVLEAIKLFLEAERCVFLVGVDQRVIEQGIRVRYQSLGFEESKKDIPIEGDEYLEKIIQIPFFLPPLEEQKIEQFAGERLAQEFGASVAEVFARGIEANPRKVKRVLNVFRLLWTLAGERGMVKKETAENEPENRKNDQIEPDLLAKMVVIQSRWQKDLYQHIIEYHNLLGDLEDHFERIEREEAKEVQPPEDKITSASQEAERLQGLTAEEGKATTREKPLVDKYAGRRPLRAMLLSPNSNRFKGRELNPYIYLTAAVSQAREEKDEELSDEAQIWSDLMSNDPTRISAAAGKVSEVQKRGYVGRLIATMSELKSNNPEMRVVAGNAIAKLGDPRFDPDAWYLPKGDTFGFVEIPEGPFMMGSDKKTDPDAYKDESPQHEVKLPTYYIAKFPVTVAQFRAFVQDSEYKAHDEDCLKGLDNHPVVFVTWHDALAYCRWLTDQLKEGTTLPEPLKAMLLEKGWVVRLPTEAEWEKAARGTEGRVYPWGNDHDPNRANYLDAGIKTTSAVGCFPGGASPYSVLDMSGNVWEWTRTLWGKKPDEPDFKYPYRVDDGRENPDAGKGYLAVLRGGAFGDYRRNMRCAYRLRYNRDSRYSDFGFRVVFAPGKPSVL